MTLWYPTARLESAGLDVLELLPATGWFPDRIDIAAPTIRTIVDDAPDDDGTIDTTTKIGARVVSIPLTIDAQLNERSLWGMTQQLRAFLDPARRTTLTFTAEEDGPELRMVLRGSKWNDPGVTMRPTGSMLAQWVAPLGVYELAAEQTVSGNPGDNQPPGGFTFPLTFPLTFTGGGASSNGALVTNVGNRWVWPTITLYGPMGGTDIVVLNSDTGAYMTFTGLTIASGDYIRIDGKAKTILDSAGNSHYDALDFAAGSTWWKLQPGDNRVFVVPDTSTIPPASFDVTWRPSWL